MTTSATTPISISLERPRSIISGYQALKVRHRGQHGRGGRTRSNFGLLFRFHIDRTLVGHLRRGISALRRIFIRSLDAILEAFDSLAKIAADIAQFFGAENQNYNAQKDEQVPNAE
jgi:hypothetical protein